MKTSEFKGHIRYKSIPAEIKKMGITQYKCAEYLGCSLSGLTHRIASDRPQIHWAIYGLANYLAEEDDNLDRHVVN
jgi:hypothetical protein